MAVQAINGNAHNCHACSASFDGRRGFNKYCSSACRRTVERQKRQANRHKNGVRKTGAEVPCAKCGGFTQFRGRGSLYCLPCSQQRRREIAKSYRSRNPEKMRAQDRRKKEAIAADPQRLEKQREYVRQRSRQKLSTVRGRLNHRMSQLIRNGLSGTKNGRSWEKLAGYSLSDLIVHLERQFLPNMGWHNIGDWHVDHILPQAMFEYETADNPAFRECWALTNLRPLWAKDNIRKGAKRTLLI